jgi:hypothetical protein
VSSQLCVTMQNVPKFPLQESCHLLRIIYLRFTAPFLLFCKFACLWPRCPTGHPGHHPLMTCQHSTLHTLLFLPPISHQKAVVTSPIKLHE